MFFKKFLKNLIANQTKYGSIKAADFTIDQWNHFLEKKWHRWYSTHNEQKSVVAGRFIRIRKNNKTKNVYIDKLDV